MKLGYSSTKEDFSYKPPIYITPSNEQAMNNIKQIEDQIIQDPSIDIAFGSIISDFIEVFDSGITPYHTRSEILTKKQFAEAQRSEKDPQIQACLKLFKLSALQLDLNVKNTNPDNPLSQELTEFTQYMLSDKAFRGTLGMSLYRVLSAIFYGYSISEKKMEYEEFGRWKGKLTVKELKTKKPGMYGFKVSPYDEIEAIRNLYTHELLPKGKFFIYTWMDDFSNPYGSPVFDVIYPFWYAKKELMKLLVLYLAKYASPTLDVNILTKTKAAKAEADKIIKVFQTSAGIRHTNDLEVKLLEASRSGQNPYLEALNWLNGEMAKAILSNVLSTNEGTNGAGSYSMSKIHHAVTTTLVEFLSKTLADAIYQQIVVPMLKWNFDPTKYTPDLYPEITFSSTEKTDIKLMAEVFKILHELGYIDNDEFDSNFVRFICEIPEKPKEEFEEGEIEEPNEEEEEDSKEMMSYLKSLYQKFKKKVNPINYDKVA